MQKEKNDPSFATNDGAENVCVTAPFSHVQWVVQCSLPCCDRRPALAACSRGAQLEAGGLSNYYWHTWGEMSRNSRKGFLGFPPSHQAVGHTFRILDEECEEVCCSPVLPSLLANERTARTGQVVGSIHPGRDGARMTGSGAR
jgi:hypothetical protein